MAEKTTPPVEYKFINPTEFLPVLGNNPLWYLDTNVDALLQKYIVDDTEGQPEEWEQGRQEVIMMFAQTMEGNAILLGSEPEGFNDDERWIPEYYGKNSNVEKDHIDTIVIHHTATKPDISIWEFEALGLLRLYIPAFKANVSEKMNRTNPITSGHYRDGKQTFFGYHHIVRTDGSHLQTLKDEYTGFHAADYKTNCRSIGIAIVGDFTDSIPSDTVLDSVARIAKQYRPEIIIGHQEVQHNGQPVGRICPGNSWSEWKTELIGKIK